jgi:hypothetical protein
VQLLVPQSLSVEIEIVQEMHSPAVDYGLIVKARVEDFDHLARLVLDRNKRQRPLGIFQPMP